MKVHLEESVRNAKDIEISVVAEYNRTRKDSTKLLDYYNSISETYDMIQEELRSVYFQIEQHQKRSRVSVRSDFLKQRIKIVQKQRETFQAGLS